MEDKIIHLEKENQQLESKIVNVSSTNEINSLKLISKIKEEK